MTSFPIPKCCASGGVPQSNICIPLDLRAFSVVIPAPPPRSPLLSSSALNDSVNFDEWVDMQGLVEEEEEEEEEDGDSDVDMDIATPSTADEENNAGSGHRDNGEAGGASSTPPDTTTAAVTNDKATPTPPASPTSPSPSPSPAAWYAHHPILDIENLDLLGVRQRRVRFAINHYDRLARDDAERPTHVDPKAVLWAYKPPTPYVAGQSCVDALVERERERQRQRQKRRRMMSSLAAAPMLRGPVVQDVRVGRGSMRMEVDMDDDAGQLRSEEQQQEWVESERERKRQQRHLHTIQARTNETAALQERLEQQQAHQQNQQNQQNQQERKNQQRMDEQRQKQQMQTPPRQQQGAFLHRRQRSDQQWATPQQTSSPQLQQRTTPHHHHRRQRSDQSWATPRQTASPQMVNHQQCTPHHHHRRQRSDQSWATPRQRLGLNEYEDDMKVEEETIQRQKAMRPVLVYERSTSRCTWRPRSLVVDIAPKAMHAIPIPLPTASSHSTSATLTPLFTPTPHIPTILLYIPLSPTHAHTYNSTGGFKSCARCTAAGLRELRRVAALVRGELVPEDLGWRPAARDIIGGTAHGTAAWSPPRQRQNNYQGRPARIYHQA
ncbi:hypothetical protein IWX90DRAFT_486160 [Phyllosticta citrichinensis]|uniref:Uncharacterized protein n=1 Tax=Phyllosticta citrichinensis TaxID=1130410 RepID=A0ABR1XSL2_9PEZI